MLYDNLIPSYSNQGEDDVSRFYLDFYRGEVAKPPAEESAEEYGWLDLGGLIGIPPELPDLIEAALHTKRHLIIHGPPGTGKTTLARKIAEWLKVKWVILTATSDWTAHEVIGGYMPDGTGGIRFEPGIVLRHFDKTLIIDEFNRADIDKAFGPLFSTLSGQPVMLPYSATPADASSPRISILPFASTAADGQVRSHEYEPGPGWRFICTINTYDKASLFQMSYALSRRFGWIYLGAPADLAAFVRDWAAQEGWTDDPLTQVAVQDSESPIVKIWSAINVIRPIGAAPIIDVMATTRQLSHSSSGRERMDWRIAAVHSLMLYVIPQMEGIREDDAAGLAEVMDSALRPECPSGALAHGLQDLRSHLASAAV